MINKNICMAFFLFLHFNAEALEQNNAPTRVLYEQLVISEEGLFYVNEENGTLEQLEAIIHKKDGLYVVKQKKSAVCGHQYGCRTCWGCSQMRCWNFCSGC